MLPPAPRSADPLATHPPAPCQVNEYPGQRTFKAIGTGDQDFVAAMTACVSSVVGTVHAECVQHRLSAKGNYISVTGEAAPWRAAAGAAAGAA